jgi:hypothetical protein
MQMTALRFRFRFDHLDARHRSMPIVTIDIVLRAISPQKQGSRQMTLAQIAGLSRAQFGRSWEKMERTIDQLELTREELETDIPAVFAVAQTCAAEFEQTPSTYRRKSGRKPLHTGFILGLSCL